MSKRLRWIGHLSVLCLVLLVAAGGVRAGVLDGLAAMGDSLTAGGSVTGSWVPVLVNERGLNFGGGGNPYNVAAGGATSSSLLSQGQHTDVAALVQSSDVTTAALLIGGNDFGGITGVQIATGTLSGAALQTFVDGVAANIITAATTVLAEDSEGFLLIGTPDVTFSPAFQSLNPTPIQTMRLADAIDGVNAQLLAFAQTQEIVYIDSSAWMRDNLQPGNLTVGGVNITVTGSSSDPHFFFQDSLHPAAVGNGMIANLGIAAMDFIYSTGVGELSDFEVLELAGIENEYTGETFSTSVDLTDYVYFTPTLPGDVNFDGIVNGLDANVISSNFLVADTGYAGGDINMDGVVNGLDANVISANFLQTNPATAIPEPSTGVLLSVAVIAYLTRRRRAST